jgi:hypothetical protein
MIAGACAGMLVTAMDFNFYGGLGSPLGAFLGYIPTGASNNVGYFAGAFI